ncbi:hypothetical protein AOLI_G00157010 [Acnodon oligacanthus]
MRGPRCLVGYGVFADLRRSDGCVRRCTRLVQKLTSPCNSIGGAVLFLQARQRGVQNTARPVEARRQQCCQSGGCSWTDGGERERVLAVSSVVQQELVLEYFTNGFLEELKPLVRLTRPAGFCR